MCQDVFTLGELHQAMNTFFPVSTSGLMKQFWTEKKLPSQSLMDYYFNKLKLAKILNISSEQTLEALSSNVNAKLRPFLIAANPANLDMWIKIASSLEEGFRHEEISSPFNGPRYRRDFQNIDSRNATPSQDSLPSGARPGREVGDRQETVENIIQKVQGSKVFSCLDISSAYWTIGLHEKDQPITCFTTTEGSYQWCKLPFGLRTAPAIFNRILTSILQKYELKNIISYFDDILVFSKDTESHLEHLGEIFAILQKEGIQLRKDKCLFFMQKINYLGYEIFGDQISPSSTNVGITKSLPPPRDVRCLRSFLGSVTHYAKFINNFNKLRAPLNDLLKKDVKFTWIEECQRSFEALKEALVSKPILQIYNPLLATHIFCDASIAGLGGVLKQEYPDGTLRPIAFYSRALRGAESKYTITELELLAIIETCKRYHPYISGQHVIVHPDHKALIWLNNFKHTNGRLFRWALKLSEYDLEFKYNKGCENHEADMLSRLPYTCFLTVQNIEQEQKSLLKPSSKLYFIKNGITYIRLKNRDMIIVPPSLQQQLISRAHESLGHPGISSMARVISTQYCFKGMIGQIKKYILKFTICQSVKKPTTPSYGLMGNLPLAEKPFDVVALDSILGLGDYNSTNNSLHVIVDHHSRYIWAYPSKSTSIAKYINIINQLLNVGKPKIIVTDRHPSFVSKRFKKFIQEKGIKHVMTSPSHPQCNGLVERANATIISKLRLHHQQNPRIPWPKLLQKALEEYRSIPHSITKMPPVYLLFGITPSYKVCPISSRTGSMKKKRAYPPIEEARRIANKNTEKLHLKLVKRYNESHKTPNLKIGDKVLYKIPYQSGQGNLMPAFNPEPYTIISIPSPQTIEIDKPCQPENKHATIVNISKVKLWNPVTEDNEENTEPSFPFQEEEDLERCLSVEPNKQASTDSPQVLFSSIKNPDHPTEPLEKLLLVSVDTQTESEPVVSYILLNTTIYNHIITKFAITKALPTSESVEVAKFFIKDVILKHGAPREVITDRGRNFTSSMIRDLNKHCRITHRTTTAYHPQTNGLTERLNKTIADMLSMYVDVNQKDWDEILPFVTFAYNTAKQESTGFSPFYLVHGREAETPLDLLFPKFPSEDEDDFIQTLGSRAEEARQLARIHTMRSQGGNKLRYDAHHRNIIYQPGVLVWIYIPVRKVGLSEKLMRHYFGPYKVTRKISDVTYEVETFGDQHGRRKTKEIVHICRMKPYLDPEKREDHLEEDMEDDLSSPQKEEVPAEGRQPPLAQEEVPRPGDLDIPGPITRSRARRLEAQAKNRDRIIVPPSLQQQLISRAHESLGHPGISSMARVISTQYYFKGMIGQIKNYILKFKICQSVKKPTTPSYGLMGNLPLAEKPFDVVALDSILGLGDYNSTKNCLHVIVDHHSRYIWAYPSKSTSIATYINIINQLLNVGKPKIIVTDRHPSFVSKRFKKFIQEKGIKHVMTSPSHPQCNGLVERANATIISKLRLHHQQNPRIPWPKLLQKALEEYRRIPHSITKMPPVYLLFGITPSYINNLTRAYPPIEEARRIANENTEKLHLKLVKRYKESHKTPNLKIGDNVLYKIPYQSSQGKLMPAFYPEPYTIISMPSPQTIEIDKPCQPENKHATIVNISKVKLWRI
ncbi:hypothetical protein LAZ67_18002262, partial [Cordylochernes scorpioides]